MSIGDDVFPSDDVIARGAAIRPYAPTLSDGFINQRHRSYADFPLRDSVAIDHPIFGWLRRDDALKLYEMAYLSNGDILELGTHKGLSSSIMAEALTDAGKDHVVVSLEVNEEYSAEARRAHSERGITNVDYKVGDARIFLDRFIKKGRKFGFAFVDHSHRFEPTRQVCERLSRLLDPGAFVLFHDFADPRNLDPANREYDVIRAVREHLPSSFKFRSISGCCALYEFAGERVGRRRNLVINPKPVLEVVDEGRARMSEGFAARIVASYRLAHGRFGGSGESMWSKFSAQKQNIHEALVDGDIGTVRALLDDPSQHLLYHGMDSLSAQGSAALNRLDAHGREKSAQQLAMNLVTLAEAIGARRLYDPTKQTEYSPNAIVSIDVLLNEIASALSLTALEFPNPFRGEFGLKTKHGVASYRAIQAVYQAWRIVKLSGQTAGGILEIGAGTGRTAYYAHKLGAKKYTIVDVPLTNVAQAAFIGSTLGEEAVSLSGESEGQDQIRIVSPELLQKQDFTLIANVDSLPEMDGSTIMNYAALIQQHSETFLSINQEAHEQRVWSLFRDEAKSSRAPYWLREGYVEEIFHFKR